jgi:hypothetical protein
MALSEDTVMTMPVAPTGAGYGGGFGGFGNDGWWVILLLLAMNGGWGFGGMGGYGAMGMMGGYGGMYEFPWLLNGQNGINANTNAGFDHAATQSALGNLSTAVTSGFGDIQTALCSGFGNVQNSLCSGFAGVNATVNSAQNSIAQQLYAGQLSDLERSFAAQTAVTGGLNNISSQLAQCCCDNRAATADVKYTLATEACNTRAANTANTQAILDKLCQLELDNAKAQIEAKNDTIAQLRSEVLYAKGQASQDVQTARILAGQNAEIDALYSRLSNCPVPSTPVYGRTPIFTCPQNVNAGCGCGNGFAN